MSWQKCPLCNGSGIDPSTGTFTGIPVCPVCDGHRIISEVNGLPPGIPGKKEDRFCDIVRFTLKKRIEDPGITMEEIEKQWKNQ